MCTTMANNKQTHPLLLFKSQLSPPLLYDLPDDCVLSAIIVFLIFFFFY
jgi:hypothetical protein